MVEQDAIAGIHSIRFAIIDGDPTGIKFGHSIGTARVKGCCFILRCFLHKAVQL